MNPAPTAAPPPDLSKVVLRPCRLNESTLAELRSAGDVSVEPSDRITHAMGKSYPDLVRLRRGEVPSPPLSVCAS